MLPLCLLLALAAGPTAPQWPKAGAPLNLVHLSHSPRKRPWRIYLDGGHGAKDNQGVASVTCEHEEDFTLRVAKDLAEHLRRTGAFEVRLSRDGARVAYEARVRAAESWKADAFLSLHADARGLARWWSPVPGTFCLRQDETPGFAVLWSSDGPALLTPRRQTLARALATRMRQAGLLAYDGVDYPGHYVGDDSHPGVFENRPGIGRRIFVLRKPTMPSVIIETHHALDFEEAARWKEPLTLEAFAAAVAASLSDVLGTMSP
ncbi:MAG: N-acetylmuramoyl-L-alanine amidase family protein [Myxococcota bacterium]